MNIVILGAFKPISQRGSYAIEEVEMARQLHEIVDKLHECLAIQQRMPLYTSTHDYTVPTYTVYKLKGILTAENDLVLQQMANVHAVCLTKHTLKPALETCKTAEVALICCKGYFSDTASFHQSPCYQQLKKVFNALPADCRVIVYDESYFMFKVNSSPVEQQILMRVRDQTLHLHMAPIDTLHEIVANFIREHIESLVEKQKQSIQESLFPIETRIGTLSSAQHNAIERRLLVLREHILANLQSFALPPNTDSTRALMMLELIPEHKLELLNTANKILLRQYHFARREHLLYNGMAMIVIDQAQVRAMHDMIEKALGYKSGIAVDASENNLFLPAKKKSKALPAKRSTSEDMPSASQPKTDLPSDSAMPG